MENWQYFVCMNYKLASVNFYFNHCFYQFHNNSIQNKFCKDTFSARCQFYELLLFNVISCIKTGHFIRYALLVRGGTRILSLNQPLRRQLLGLRFSYYGDHCCPCFHVYAKFEPYLNIVAEISLSLDQAFLLSVESVWTVASVSCL